MVLMHESVTFYENSTGQFLKVLVSFRGADHFGLLLTSVGRTLYNDWNSLSHKQIIIVRVCFYYRIHGMILRVSVNIRRSINKNY